MFDSIDLPPAALHEIVIVGHRLADTLVRRERLLHGEEVVDPFNGCLGDDGPVRLTGHIGKQAKRLLPLFLQHAGDNSEFFHHRPHFPRLAVQNLTDYVHDVLLSFFAAAMMRPMLSFDMKSPSGMAPVIADRKAFVAS